MINVKLSFKTIRLTFCDLPDTWASTPPDVSTIGWQWSIVIEFYVKLTLFIVSYNSVQNGLKIYLFNRPFN